MEISVNKFRRSICRLMELLQAKQIPVEENRVLADFLKTEKYTAHKIELVLNFLRDRLVDDVYTEPIAIACEQWLLLILTLALRCDETVDVQNFSHYQKKCVALAKLMRWSVDAKRYAPTYFRNKPAPFDAPDLPAVAPVDKKPKNDATEPTTSGLDGLTITKCCYELLSTEAAYFRDLWNWAPYISMCLKAAKANDLRAIYSNHIVAILSDMSPPLLRQLNEGKNPERLLEFYNEQKKRPPPLEGVGPQQTDLPADQFITLNLNSEPVANIEDVLLAVFNKDNYNFYAESDGGYDTIVRVDSTRVNLRSIALGIAAAKTICLSGPVGCGKTTLVEYLARKTGRICPKRKEIEIEEDNQTKTTSKGETGGQENGANTHNSNNTQSVATKRKGSDLETLESLESSLQQCVNDDGSGIDGFLRIQLGDQTDSKMLLGQYRCTDVPGEFIWLPGVLTQAVMNGFWLLLEDLDSATQDTYTILSSLLEQNSLSVPGFRDCVKIAPGFQLFVTVRTNKSSTNSAQKSLFSLLEKYLYTVNILPLSRNELCKVVSSNFPKLATVANRIVDVFLTFSSGDHSSADNLRQQESGDKADNTEHYVALPFEAVSLAAVPNSGRLVSTRDLVKLCQRSNPMFSVTSTECAYFVFQNAVDVFCSYLPQGGEKTKLIVSIGAKLGIIKSRCEYFADEYRPEVLTDHKRIKVGRVELPGKRSETGQNGANDSEDEVDDDMGSSTSKSAKRQRLSRAASKVTSGPRKGVVATFSFTRMASCLLERIAVCISHEEPVLLVGETGVGKTSAVQYLAERTHHKLVVVNMNNQSDVADLVGGFKPVDLTYVLAPLRTEFEALFRSTYNTRKNETFLSKISICFHQGSYGIIVKLMIKVVNGVMERADRQELGGPEALLLLPRWQGLHVKLAKVHAQLEKSIKISFAFIPGSLVNCIENGDWVLLDEINLASAETLECLSTILEPQGSVVLLERGDFTPVKRHSDFRIFACMNPNTDIGKKDLSVGIRNRFTEFFADDLTTDADLSLLVSDYLSSTGIQKRSVTSIVKLYKHLKLLARLELNDGLGNRPVFSLRTLCRSLRICAKNLCGSVERNLYESFCMSFLTQLDPTSHAVVLQLIKTALLSNEKAVLKQGIPCPGENFLNFEGYWIQRGTRPLNECANYILTDSVRENLKDLSRIIAIGKLPVLLQGPTSAGKTSLIEYVAKRSGNHCLRINNHEHTDLQEYIGTYTADETGELSFREGVLVQAMRAGHWIILDELNLASTDILEALNRVLDDNRELFIPETQTVVRAHANFMLFATQNPPGLYGGRKTLSRAFKNRFIELHFSDIPRDELEIILERRCLIPASFARKMVSCMSDLQKNRKSTASRNVFTLRDLFRWGNRYTYADKKLLDDNKYDWNQHLVEEGYLVLSAKVRTAVEIDVIEETLYRNFRKRVALERLFDATAVDSCSPVTKDIIDGIRAFKSRANDIVWTRNMTRMAVLTAKALQFDEPVLLVGPTGCGKTTVCQLLARMRNVQLRILNCHMHTEGADFLGGLRPCRHQSHDDDDRASPSTQRKLFEWADGPLIHSMLEGSYFMADEISLAEDSVLERLNCILEPERTVLLAEKGGVAAPGVGGGDGDAQLQVAAEFVVQAHSGFQFLATMNPGGDFGKKELSPALRNRFTEIWCLPSDSKDDLVQIAAKHLRMPEALITARYLVDIVLHIRERVEKFRFSVRDIIAWAHYMVSNAHLTFAERAIFGLETIFLDALEMLPHESLDNVEALKRDITDYAIAQAKVTLQQEFSLELLEEQRGTHVLCDGQMFGIRPFFLDVKRLQRDDSGRTHRDDGYVFAAPTTRRNLFRLLSALTLDKPVLLEGPPGVGKTSIVESLAAAIGHRIVRINLCEHTDLADLFGTDLPAEDNVLTASAASTAKKQLFIELDENSNDGDDEDGPTVSSHVEAEAPAVGSFVWRDGPLLAALRAENTWILLDELNLAPQSVLEGLNAILDHRGEVYIPELNQTFRLGDETRIFACQNPLKQGGGRKGLPQSFLNRFNKVYLRKLSTDDMLHIMSDRYSGEFARITRHFNSLLAAAKIAKKDENVFDVYRRHKSQISKGKCGCQAPMPGARSVGAAMTPADLLMRMVQFSEALESGVAAMSFGYKGGPFEFNLRDMLHWCDLVVDERTGYVHAAGLEDVDPVSVDEPTVTCSSCRERFVAADSQSEFEPTFLACFERFLAVLYERMKLVYCQRMRCAEDKRFIRDTFARIFNCDAESLNACAEDVCLYWTDERVYLNDIVLERSAITVGGSESQPHDRRQTAPLLLGAQRELLKNCVECVHMQKPVLLCGATDSGKTKLIDALCTLANQTCNTDTIDDSVTGSFQQIDLNRHLEEISRTVQQLFLVHIQQTIAAGERAEEVGRLWHLWSKYNALALSKPAVSSPSHQNAMSAEVQLFRRRVERLNQICKELLLADETIEATLEGQRRQLAVLQQHVRQAQSLNMGGSFEWVDSKIVKSLKCGHYLLLEHVNLCSSAVLDRLNPVFEPNGELLIAEKGVTSTAATGSGSEATDQAEIVRKSANFRAFLTFDPRNGELSRAMRNRCIELALTKDGNNAESDSASSGYETDDMRALVYVSGMRETSGIECILAIHGRIAALSTIHSCYHVAHVTQFAFVASSYRRIGYALKRALYVSAMEVYVYAAHTDLLGYGLPFFQNKLRDIVQEETRRLCAAEVDLANVILHSGDLNQMSLVRLQAEPLKLLLKAQPQPEGSADDIPQAALALLRHRFTQLNLEGLGRAQLSRFYVYMLYECSSMLDAELRYHYLAGLLTEHPQLLELSAALYALVRSFALQPANSCLRSQLPWNVLIYPRLRDYVDRPTGWTAERTLSLSAALVLQLLLPEVPQERAVKLHEMNALAYSQAVEAKRMVDKLDKNHLIKQLYIFVESLRAVCVAPLSDGAFTVERFVELCTAALWFNRFLATAREQPLFVDNVPNRLYLDKLLLHFEWLEKRFLRLLKAIKPRYRVIDSDFDITLSKLSNYDQDALPPMALVRKKYSKMFFDFQPFHCEQQVRYFELTQQLEQLLGVVPLYGVFAPDLVLKKFAAHKLEVVQRCRAIVMRTVGQLFECRWLQDNQDDRPYALETAPEILGRYKQYEPFITALKTSPVATLEPGDLETLEAGVSAVKDFLNAPTDPDRSQSMPEHPKDIELGLLALREYFVLRALMGHLNIQFASRSDHDKTCPATPNWDYCDEVAASSSGTWRLINLARSAHLRAYRELSARSSRRTGSFLDSDIINAGDMDDPVVAQLRRAFLVRNTYDRLYTTSSLHYQLHNLAVRYSCTAVLESPSEEIDWRYERHGGTLVNCLRRLLVRSDGSGLKPVPLTDLALWQGSLQQMRTLLWQNSAAQQETYSGRHNNALMERIGKMVDDLVSVVENSSTSIVDEYRRRFFHLVKSLGKEYHTMKQISMYQRNAALTEQLEQFTNALLNAIVGAVDVCGLTHLPLLDPVAKTRLKHTYAAEDIDCLRSLSTGYDFMRVMMRYERLGSELDAQLRQRLAALRAKQRRYAEKVAVRPAGQCLYAALVRDISHYLQTNCDPATLWDVIDDVRRIVVWFVGVEMMRMPDDVASHLDEAAAVVPRLDLWISNAQHFVQHILRPYKAYYRDIVQPLVCSLNTLRFGFEGMKQTIGEIRAAHVAVPMYRMIDISRQGLVHEILKNVGTFPHVFRLHMFMHENRPPPSRDVPSQSMRVHLLQLLQLDSSETPPFMSLLRSKLGELRNLIAISGGCLGGKNFIDLRCTVAWANAIWLREEEQRQRKKAADESLYVNKTRCADEDEELLELQEIAEHFPNTAHEDFGEFVAEATLEQQHHQPKVAPKPQLTAKQGNNILPPEDYAFLARTFIEIMERYTHVHYWRGGSGADARLEIVMPFRERFRIFNILYEKYRPCLNDWLDREMYGSFSFAVGLQQQALNTLTLTTDSSSEGSGAANYNFYKDSNIGEIVACTALLDRIDECVRAQLELYPEHAALGDVRRVVERIRQLPAEAPLVRFSTGFQILRQKLALWNELAHKRNHLRREELEAAEYVQRWTRLELQCWRQCLSQTDTRVAESAYKYWFFIYNLCEEYRQQRGLDATLTDIKFAEQRFAQGDVVDLQQTGPGGSAAMWTVTAADVVRVLRQFMEAACYGDFAVRMHLLRSFEMYLQHVVADSDDDDEDGDHLCVDLQQQHVLITGIHNLHIYFAQFAPEVEATRREMRAPIEKKLKEQVKIESYNKDLSYFSMRNNVARVHRNLNKLLREYEQKLRLKITPVFQPKDATVGDYQFGSGSSSGGYSLNPAYYVAKQQPQQQPQLDTATAGEEFDNQNDDDDATTMPPPGSLLQRAASLFGTSRRVVRRTIAQVQYPQLIAALDELFGTQLARCEQLRQLSVDRSRERPKQVLEAKQILQQKRKALTDLFKTLAQLGMSFKAGLMELTLRGDKDFEDFRLEPFCIETMLCAEGEFKPPEGVLLSAQLRRLNANLDTYYAKCVFKLKLLQNHMLTPLAELGPPNIERIKGFAVNLFVLVRQQRALLATTTRQLYTLRTHLESLRQIATICDCETSAAADKQSPIDFISSRIVFDRNQRVFARVRYIFEQLRLLLQCVPEQYEGAEHAFATTGTSLVKQSPFYARAQKYCTDILSLAMRAHIDTRSNDGKFLHASMVGASETVRDTIMKLISDLRLHLKSDASGQWTPLEKTFEDLNEYLCYVGCIESDPPQPAWHHLYDFDDVDTEFGLAPDMEAIFCANVTANIEAMDDSELPDESDDDCVDFNINGQIEIILESTLLSLQKLYKKYTVDKEKATVSAEDVANDADDPAELALQPAHLKQRLHGELFNDWQLLNVEHVNGKLANVLNEVYVASPSPQKVAAMRSLVAIRPLLDQYRLMGEYYLGQQMGAHKISAKMLSTMLTVFVEISTKGFCVPPDLQHDEEGGQARQDQKEGEGFGLEDGTGEKDASDKLESEDQLDDAKRPEDRKDEGDKPQDDCKEEKGIEMSDDFEGKTHDIEKPEEDDSGESEEEKDDLNKEMGETEEGADKLDEQIWGDDDEEEPNEPEEDDKELNEEDDGKGSKDEKDAHNDLDKRNDAATKDDGQDDEHDKDGLDATNEPSANEEKRKEQAKDIDDMKDPAEEDEEQTNTYHNELEEPPEPEEMDLGEMGNGDEDREEGDERDGDENPFDIDKMKENMPTDDAKPEEDETNADDMQDNESKGGSDHSDSEDDGGGADDAKKEDESMADDEAQPEEVEANKDEAAEMQKRGDEADEKPEDEAAKDEAEEKREEKLESHVQSKDKSSKEENVHSLPETENKGSADQVENEENSEDVRQEQKLDEQETGEEKDGVGQAENDTNDGGHQGIAETRETATLEERKNERQTEEKRKQGRTNEERTLGEAEKNKLKQLKTIDKMKEPRGDKDDENEDDIEQADAEEHQHVKEAKSSDKTTLDNATEEQTKRMQHQDDELPKEDDEPAVEEGCDELMEVDEPADDDRNDDKHDELKEEKFDQVSEKASKSDKTNERAEMPEKMDIEGEIVLSASVARNDDTTAHCNKEILLDNLTLAQEPSTGETLEMRRLYQQQLLSGMQAPPPEHDDRESWQTVSTRMAQNARELCEQLRLILEPTKCTRLRGDYRTGRRINMKKIIPYIASQFRKDKIWLRRTKPAQRDYKITIAIDDSKSMHHNNSKTLTLEAISLVSQALTLLESGRLCIVSFGEAPHIILNHSEQLDGPRLVSALNFDQNKTNIAELLHFVRTANAEEGASGSDNGLFENLLLVLSDGRNIFSEGKAKVRNAIKLARLQRIFLVYIIIDNPDNKDSILDIQTMDILPDKGISIKSYLDEFPFPYYVIVRDLNQLPLVLSEAMRQWFELVNSE